MAISDDEIRDALAKFHGNKARAARFLNMPVSTLKDRLKKFHPIALDDIPVDCNFSGFSVYRGDSVNPSFTCTFNDCTASIASVSTSIRTADQALAEAQVDRSLWDIERQTVNAWEAPGPDGQTVQMFQVKVHLKRKTKPSPEDWAKTFRAAMEGYEPAFTQTLGKPKTDPRHLLELCLPDMHFGKLGWRREVGENFDLRIAEERYLEAVAALLARVQPQDVEEIVLLVGSDFFHSDTKIGSTTGGTLLDTDGRWQKAFQVGLRSVVKAIDMCAQVADVHVVVIPGNHDWTTSFYLGSCLECQYATSSCVTVDNQPPSRKYFRYGCNLIGWTHGHNEKHAELPLIMAQERPDDWAQTKYRTWHLGHMHLSRKKRTNDGDTFTGVVVEIVPALCGTDAWHSEQGYVASQKAGKAFLYHRDHGPVAIFQHNVM